jgi:hypothetical protein
MTEDDDFVFKPKSVKHGEIIDTERAIMFKIVNVT